MKPIKFRAWQKHHKQMVKVTRIDFNRNLITADYGEKTVPRFNTFEQDNFILMQYTGLRDKNGTEIYEGDIVRLYEKGTEHEVGTHVVEWIDESEGGFSIGWGLFNNTFDYEVIGNIYKHPHLLGDTDES
jgi:uncharacterized phage protein (TIGR01671 family)